MPKKSGYEKIRDANIAKNQTCLASLGLGPKPVEEKKKKLRKKKAEKADKEEVRHSVRGKGVTE